MKLNIGDKITYKPNYINSIANKVIKGVITDIQQGRHGKRLIIHTGKYELAMWQYKGDIKKI